MAQIPEIQEHSAPSELGLIENKNDEGIVFKQVNSKGTQNEYSQPHSLVTEDILPEPPRDYMKGWRLYVLTFAYRPFHHLFPYIWEPLPNCE